MIEMPFDVLLIWKTCVLCKYFLPKGKKKFLMPEEDQVGVL